MMHILVVNSDAAVRDRLYQWLNAAEYDITVWEENPQALDLNQFSEPLLIIGDWQQATASDCLSTWQDWKAHPDSPPIFCLMLIATDHLDNLVPALAAGADDWLTYPLDEMTLRARLLACQQVLQLRQDLQAQKAQLQTELAEAEAYVRSLLPQDLTQKVPINARFIPSSSLGGDCYDYYWLDPDYLVIYLAGCFGPWAGVGAVVHLGVEYVAIASHCPM
jgi:sigma-B regulation protein RsbU (phosphoserine phosphatase)